MVNLCRQGAEDCFNQGWFLRRAAALKENLALNNVQSCDKEEEEEDDDDVYICSLVLNNDQGFDKEEEDDECWTMITDQSCDKEVEDDDDVYICSLR